MMNDGRAERTSEICPPGAFFWADGGQPGGTVLGPQDRFRSLCARSGQVELLYRRSHPIERLPDVVEGHLGGRVVVQRTDRVDVDATLVQDPAEPPSASGL
jgi:hypothetical protein